MIIGVGPDGRLHQAMTLGRFASALRGGLFGEGVDDEHPENWTLPGPNGPARARNAKASPAWNTVFGEAMHALDHIRTVRAAGGGFADVGASIIRELRKIDGAGQGVDPASIAQAVVQNNHYGPTWPFQIWSGLNTQPEQAGWVFTGASNRDVFRGLMEDMKRVLAERFGGNWQADPAWWGAVESIWSREQAVERPFSSCPTDWWQQQLCEGAIQESIRPFVYEVVKLIAAARLIPLNTDSNNNDPPPPPPAEESKSMPGWVIPAAIGGVAAIGVAIYLATRK